MIDTQLYALLRELNRRRHPAGHVRHSDAHRGLQRSAREITLSVRRQRHHGEVI
jgi:hypothetical protein